MERRKIVIIGAVATLFFLLGLQLVPLEALKGHPSTPSLLESLDIDGNDSGLISPDPFLGSNPPEQDPGLAITPSSEADPIECMVLTDLASYLPNETVEISGAQFPPEMPITVNVSRPCCCGEHPFHWEVLSDVYSDENGEFVALYNLTKAVGLYNITASCDSHNANNSFIVNPCRILTDRSNYEPFDTVTFFGTGFHANTEVNITLTFPDDSTDSWCVESNSAGNFTTTYTLEENIGTCFVFANDSIFVATSWFTDPYLYILPSWSTYGGSPMIITGWEFWGSVYVTLHDSVGHTFNLGSTSPNSNGYFQTTFQTPYATPGPCTISAESSGYVPIQVCHAKCCDVCVFWLIWCWDWDHICSASRCGETCYTHYEYRHFYSSVPYEISNIRPHIETGGPYQGYLGWPLQFDGSDSYDIDTPGEKVVQYEWDFGDGTKGSGSKPTHTYDALGVYTVNLTCWDKWGAWQWHTTTATIVEPPPEPVADANGPSAAYTGQLVFFDGSDSYDMDGTIVSYEWAFGDGHLGSGINPPHIYSMSGTYTIQLNVTDNDGYSDLDTITIIIEDVPNTEPGTNIIYTDPDTGLTILFPVVYQNGATRVTPGLTGPSPPSGHSVYVYYEISSTASYTGTLLIGIPYHQYSLHYPLFESYLTLWYWDPAAKIWINITHSVNTVSDIIYGLAPRLGIFAIMEIVDETAPLTTPHPDGNQGAEGWYTSPVEVSLSSSDDISGVAVTMFRFEGQVFTTYTDPISIESTGEYTIYFYSIDFAGNREGIKHIDIKVDLESPETTYELEGIQGESDWYVSDVNVVLTAIDPGSGSGVATTYYRIDDGLWQIYNDIFTLGDGAFNITFYSKDVAGNVEGYQKFNLSIDTQDPCTTILPTGTFGLNGWFNTSVTINFEAVDGLGSGIVSTYYRIGMEGSLTPYPTEFTLWDTGVYDIFYYSIDAAGNIEPVQQATINIDTTKPSTECTPSGVKGVADWYVSPVTMTLDFTDTGSGVEYTYYRINGGSWIEYSTPFTISTDGIYAVDYWSIDYAGNAEVMKTTNIGIDFTQPETSIYTRFSPGVSGQGWWIWTPAYPLGVRFEVAGVEYPQSELSAISYSFDGETWQEYSGGWVLFPGEGIYTVYYNSTDMAGNVEVTKTKIIRLDGTLPDAEVFLDGVQGTDDWYLSDVEVSIVAWDVPSGLFSSFYTINGGERIYNTDPFPILTDGTNTIQWGLMDRAGWIKSGTFTVKIDKTPPVTTPSLAGSQDGSGRFITDVIVTLIASSDTSGIKLTGYSFDGLSWMPYSGPFTIFGPGTRTIYFNSADNAGNAEETHTVVVSIGGTVTINSDGTVSPASAPIIRSGNTYTFTSNIYATFNVYANNIVIDGDGYKLQLDVMFGFRLSYSHHVTIRNVVLEDFIYAIHTQYSSDLIIEGNTFNNIVDIGVLFQFSCENNLVSHNTFTNCWECVRIRDSSFNKIFENNLIGGWYGITIHAADNPCSNNQIWKNTMLDLGYFGVWLITTGPEANNIIEENTMTNCIVGINSILADGNSILDNIITGSTQFGIWFYDSSENEILRNTISSSSQEGLLIDYSSNFNNISDNLISNNMIGIRFQRSSAENYIYHNAFIGNQYQALDSNPTVNYWYSSELLEGNFWSNYYGVDDGSGIGKHAIAGDFIGDTYLPFYNDPYPFVLTTVTVSGLEGNDPWYQSDVMVTLNTINQFVTITETRYSLDGVSWFTYDSPYIIIDEGLTTVSFYSVYDSGINEYARTQCVYIDKTIPSTDLIIGTPFYEDVIMFVTSDTPLSLTTSDSISGVYYTYYQIDGGSWTEYASFEILGADGFHTIDYYSVDIAGNVEVGKSCTLFLDNTAPHTSIILSGGMGMNDWFSTPVDISLVPDDGTGCGTSIIYYIRDFGSSEIFNNIITEIYNGYHWIEYWSVDNLGNTEISLSAGFKIDTEKPSTTAVLQPTTPDGLNDWYVSPVTLSLYSEDPLSGVWRTFYQVNGGLVEIYSSPVVFSLDGLYTVEYWSIDYAGNIEVANSIYFQIDQTDPITKLTIHPPKYGSDPTFVSTATEFSFDVEEVLSGVARIEYRIDGGGWVLCMSTFNVPDIGPHTIDYRSVDVAGNVEAYQSVAIMVNASELIYTGELSGTYSDPAYLEARLIDVATTLPIAGKMIHFQIGYQTASATTNSTGYASVTMILNQPSGTYQVSASFDNDGEYLTASSENYDFTIEKEIVYVEYTGSTVVPTTAGTIILRATVFDHVDGYWGDLTKVNVTFRIYTVTTDAFVLQLPVWGPYQVETTVVEGVGAFEMEIHNLPENSYIIIISLDPEDNAYYQSMPSEDAVIIVYEPTGDFVTGGGWVWDSEGHKGNFGFNVKYKKNGLPKGQFIYIYRTDEYKFIIKATAWLGMAIIDDHSFFEAKCIVQQYNLETGELIWSEGNYKIRVDVWDHAEVEGSDDVFQMRIYDKIGILYHEVGFDPYGFLQGGSIVIHTDEKK